MSIYQPSYYGRQKYPEGPMWMSAGADMISAISQGIEAYKDRKMQEERFEKGDALAKAQRETDEQRYTTKMFGETADREEELRRYALAQARQASVDEVMGERWQSEQNFAETKEQNLQDYRTADLASRRGAGGDGDPMKTYSQARAILEEFDDTLRGLDDGRTTIEDAENMLASVTNASPHRETLQEFMAGMDMAPSKQELFAMKDKARAIEGFGILEQEILDRHAKLVSLDPALPDSTGGIVKTDEREIRPEIMTALEGATSVLPGGRGLWDLPRSIPKIGSTVSNWLYTDSDDERKRRALADSLGGL